MSSDATMVAPPSPCQSPHDTYMNNRLFGSLDGLRAFSILAVIWHHVSDRALSHIPFLEQGPFGVELFFAISGFLVTTLLLREQDRTGNISRRNFYLRRVLRIWPLYFAVLAVYTLLVLTFERHTPQGEQFLKTLPYFVTFTSNWSPHHTSIFVFAWSLATLEQFYLIWPTVLKRLPAPGPALFLLLLIALDMAAVAGLPSPVRSYPLFIEGAATGIATPMCLGALVALLLRSPAAFAFLYRFLGRRWSAPAAMGLLMVVRAGSPLIGPIWPLFEWPVLVLVIGSGVIREDNGMAPVLTSRLMMFIGSVSYGIYLMHSLVMHAVRIVMHRIGLDYLAPIFLATSAGAIGVAWLSARYYESLFMGIKERFVRRRSAPQTAETSQGAGPAVSPASS